MLIYDLVEFILNYCKSPIMAPETLEDNVYISFNTVWL